MEEFSICSLAIFQQIFASVLCFENSTHSPRTPFRLFSDNDYNLRWRRWKFKNLMMKHDYFVFDFFSFCGGASERESKVRRFGRTCLFIINSRIDAMYIWSPAKIFETGMKFAWLFIQKQNKIVLKIKWERESRWEQVSCMDNVLREVDALANLHRLFKDHYPGHHPETLPFFSPSLFSFCCFIFISFWMQYTKKMIALNLCACVGS